LAVEEANLDSIGFGMALVIGAAPMLVAEISHPQDRAILCTFMGCSYHLGSFISSWVTFGTLQITSDWAWRLPSLLQCTCTIVVLSVIWFIPESPRFYIAKDRNEDAKRVLAHYHADGNQDDEFVRVEYTEIHSMLMMDRQANRSSRYIDFFRTKGNRKRISLVIFIALFSQWSGNGIVSYYLRIVLESIGIEDSRDQLGINGGLKAMSLVANVILAFFVDRFGRKPLFMASTIGMLVSFTIWTIISARYDIEGGSEGGNASLGRGVVVMIYFFDLAYVSTSFPKQSPNDIREPLCCGHILKDCFKNVKTGLGTTYNLEILPYGLRAKGTTIASLTILIALFFNQFVNPIALDAIEWRYCKFESFVLGRKVPRLIEIRHILLLLPALRGVVPLAVHD
jgi:MFS family permease